MSAIPGHTRHTAGQVGAAAPPWAPQTLQPVPGIIRGRQLSSAYRVIGLSSYNFKHHVGSNIPENGQYVSNQDLQTQEYLTKTRRGRPR